MRTYNLGKGRKKVNKFTNLTTAPNEKHCPRRFWPSLKPCPHFGRHTLGIGKAVNTSSHLCLRRSVHAFLIAKA
jgi:hypothetical protein